MTTVSDIYRYAVLNGSVEKELSELKHGTPEHLLLFVIDKIQKKQDSYDMFIRIINRNKLKQVFAALEIRKFLDRKQRQC